MDHTLRFKDWGPYVIGTCNLCGLTATSVTRDGASRMLRRKHKDQGIRARARERARG